MKSKSLDPILSVAETDSNAPLADEAAPGTEVAATITLVIQRSHDGAVLRIQGHDQVLAQFDGTNALANARQALAHVQRAIVKYGYQAGFVYAEMVAREAERLRVETQLRSLDSSISKLSSELRNLTEY